MGCIWKVAEEDRHCEFCSFRGGCEKYPIEFKPDAGSVAEYYVDIFAEILGKNVLVRTKKPIFVWGRYMIAYQMRLEGYSLGSIGRALGLHHTTVLHGLAAIGNMLKYPRMYPRETKIWDSFQQKIKML